MPLSDVPVLGWSEEDRAWVAGLLDGEGWIGIARTKSAGTRGGIWYRAGITVNQTRPEMVDRLHRLLGERGTRFVIKKAKQHNRKDAEGIDIVNQGVVEAVLDEVLPYLIVKKSVAQVVLDFRRYMRASRHGTARGEPKEWARFYVLTEHPGATETPPPDLRRLPSDDAWLAALIDGEGTITINFVRGTRGRGAHVPRIEVGSTTEALVRRVHQIVGIGSVQCERRGVGRTSGEKSLWRWIVGSQGVASILDRVEPHLLLKRDQARVVRELLSLPRAKGRTRLPEWVWDRRVALRAELQQLNKKGRTTCATR